MTADLSEEDQLAAEAEAALASDDWVCRRQGLDQAGDLLRQYPKPAIVARVAKALEPLAHDAKWEIRNDLAGVIQHLRHPVFDSILATLVEDDNAYVCRSAERALRRRHQARQRELEVESVMLKVDRLAARHSPEIVSEVRDLGRAYFAAVAASAAHDIRSVLTSLRQTLKSTERELGQRKVAKKAWQPGFEVAEQRCKLIEAIVGDMKDFASTAPPRFQKAAVLEMVQEAAAIVRDRFQGAPDAPAVRLDIGIERHRVIDAPRARLVQALTNILKNAFEAIEREGTVRITAQAVGRNEIQIEIADDGIGIPAEDLAEVFVPGRSTKKGWQGCNDNTGWGLAIAQRIVEGDCGGVIDMQSEEGKGTTILIRLPVEQSLNGGL